MRAFWVDRRDDRYETTVQHSLGAFDETLGDISPVRFAGLAWVLATPPALDPGFVRWHRRILTAMVGQNPYDGGLSATVTMVSPWPAELTWSKQWGRDRGWRDWPQVLGQFVEPSDQDVSRHPFLMGTLTVRAPVPLDHLPPPPEHRDDDLPATARRMVTVIVRELDALLEPVLTQLDGEVVAKPN